MSDGSMNRPDAVLIAGPTASGKSRHAIELAERLGGEIINTDSMQVYPVLRVLTARPDHDDLMQVPHHLYGTAALDQPYSVAKWHKEATGVAEEIWSRGKAVIFVGGTGLYFKSIEEGLSEVPDIPPKIREEVRQTLLDAGSEALHTKLTEVDPDGADKLRPSDGHRIARALEVVLAHGKPLAFFQEQQKGAPFLAGRNVEKRVLMPERSVLHERIDIRSELMFVEGALEEARSLLAMNLPTNATVLKAIGISQVKTYIHGEQTLNQCIDKVKAATRQYAKRQSTWFRGQFSDSWAFIDPTA